MIPTIEISLEEFKTGLINDETLQKAYELFTLHGVLLVKNVFMREFIEKLRKSFLSNYKTYLNDRKFKDALKVGDKQHMVTIKLIKPFNTPYLYANLLIFPIIQRILGQNCIINSFTSVVSLPWSKD